MGKTDFKFDPMFDRWKTHICRKHIVHTDEYGDCPDCLRGVDPLGQLPDEPKDEEDKKASKHEMPFSGSGEYKP